MSRGAPPDISDLFAQLGREERGAPPDISDLYDELSQTEPDASEPPDIGDLYDELHDAQPSANIIGGFPDSQQQTSPRLTGGTDQVTRGDEQQEQGGQAGTDLAELGGAFQGVYDKVVNSPGSQEWSGLWEDPRKFTSEMKQSIDVGGAGAIPDVAKAIGALIGNWGDYIDNKTGILESFRALAKEGVVQRGPGRDFFNRYADPAAQAVGDLPEHGRTMEEWAKDMEEAIMMMAPEAAKIPYSPQWFALNIVRTSPPLLAGVGITVMGGGVALGLLPAFILEGGHAASEAYERALEANAHLPEAEAKEIAAQAGTIAALTTGLVNAGLERLQILAVLKKTGVVRAFVNNAATGALTEATQEVTAEGIVASVSDQQIDPDLLDHALQAGSIGALMEGSIGAGSAVIQGKPTETTDKPASEDGSPDVQTSQGEPQRSGADVINEHVEALQSIETEGMSLEEIDAAVGERIKETEDLRKARQRGEKMRKDENARAERFQGIQTEEEAHDAGLELGRSGEALTDFPQDEALGSAYQRGYAEGVSEQFPAEAKKPETIRPTGARARAKTPGDLAALAGTTQASAAVATTPEIVSKPAESTTEPTTEREPEAVEAIDPPAEALAETQLDESEAVSDEVVHPASEPSKEAGTPSEAKGSPRPPAETETAPAVVGDKLVAMAKRLEQQAHERMAQRSRPAAQTKPGVRGGSAPLLQDIVDAGVIAGARMVMAGVKGGQAAAKIVSQVIAEKNPALAAVSNRIHSVAIGIVTDSRGDPDLLDSAISGVVDPIKTKPVAGVKAQVRQATGQTDLSEPTVTEAQALRAGLGKASRAANAASRGATREARAVFRAELRSVKGELREAARTKAKGIVEIKANLVRVIRSNLPVGQRDRMLTHVEKATTFSALSRGYTAIRREMAFVEGRDLSERIDRLAKPKKIRKMTVLRRKRLQSLNKRAGRVAVMYKRSRPKGTPRTTTAALESGVERLNKLHEEAAGIVAESKAERHAITWMQRKSRKALVKIAVGDIERSKEPAEESIEDRKTPWMKRVHRGLHDVDTATSMVEGKWKAPGILRRLLGINMKRAEENYLAALRDAIREVDAAVRASGYKDLNDAVLKTGVSAGSGKTVTLKLTIGGKTREVPLGLAIGLAAIDIDTESIIVGDGNTIQFEGGRFTKPLTITADELGAVRDNLGPEHLALIDALKNLMEARRGEVGWAVYRLRGFQPDNVLGYWPRKRNTQLTDQAGLPELAKVADRYIENLGFTERRTGGSSPILIRDALTTAIEHVTNQEKIIHLSEAVRDATGVLMHPDVQTAITARWGARMNQDLQDFLSAASRANEFSEADLFGRLTGFINSNFAVSKLALNHSTWLVQLGGVLRMMPSQFLGPASTVLAIPMAFNVSIAELSDRRGYFWERYSANVFGRFSAVASQNAMSTALTPRAIGLDSMIRSVLKGDYVGALRAWRLTGASLMQILNWFDAFNARVAFAAALHQSKATNKIRTEEEHRDYAAGVAVSVIRETQNSSSSLDKSVSSLRVQGTALSAVYLFKSDVIKSRNRIIRAAKKSPKDGAEVLAAEVANILYVTAARRTVSLGLGMLVAAMLGDDEEADRAMRLAFDLEDALLDAVSELGDLVEPLVLPNFVDAIRGYRGGPVDAPVMSEMEEFTRGASEWATAFKKLEEGDQRAAIRKFVIGLDRIARAGFSVGLGNPADPIWRRFSAALARKTDPNRQIEYTQKVVDLRQDLTLLNRIRKIDTLTEEEGARREQLVVWNRTFTRLNQAAREALKAGDKAEVARLKEKIEAWSDRGDKGIWKLTATSYNHESDSAAYHYDSFFESVKLGNDELTESVIEQMNRIGTKRTSLIASAKRRGLSRPDVKWLRKIRRR